MATNYADDRIVKVVINRNDAKVDFQNQGRFGVSMRDVRPCLENGNQVKSKKKPNLFKRIGNGARKILFGDYGKQSNDDIVVRCTAHFAEDEQIPITKSKKKRGLVSYQEYEGEVSLV